MKVISEELLSYLWEYKKFKTSNLYSEEGIPIQIIDTGEKNFTDGPDFTQVRLRINGQLWAGSTEIDVSAQNWEKHNHHSNPNYNNVILRVIYDENYNYRPAYRSDGTKVLTLNLKKYIPYSLIQLYEQMLVKEHAFIPCEKVFSLNHIPVGFTSSMLIERVIEKNEYFYCLYQQHLDWQEVFWVAFVRGLGYVYNADSFTEIAENIPFKIIQKYQDDTENLEAILFGVAGMLKENQENETEEKYFTLLKTKWLYLQNKHNLEPILLNKIRWKDVRPANFPTIRLMLLSKIIQQYPDLIKEGFTIKTVREWYKIFKSLSTQHDFWDNHYTFTKKSSTKVKKIGKSAINNLLINCILPVQMLYYYHNNPEKIDEVLQVYEDIPSESNTITNKWHKMGVSLRSAYDTQAWLQLYKKYCIPKKCLSCRIGMNILVCSDSEI